MDMAHRHWQRRHGLHNGFALLRLSVQLRAFRSDDLSSMCTVLHRVNRQLLTTPKSDKDWLRRQQHVMDRVISRQQALQAVITDAQRHSLCTGWHAFIQNTHELAIMIHSCLEATGCRPSQCHLPLSAAIVMLLCLEAGYGVFAMKCCSDGS